MRAAQTSSTDIRTKMHTHLRSLSKRRTDGFVTADDANKFLDTSGVSPYLTDVRLSITRSVLNKPEFRASGWTTSRRPVARNRSIRRWKYSGK